MGIIISNAAMTTTLATLRTGNVPATLPIAFATANASHPGMTFVETGAQLVALLRKNGMPMGRELRVQWAPSPSAPASAVNDVRNALALGGFGGIAVHAGQNQQSAIGAQAYAQGNSPAFHQGPQDSMLGHEAVHVVQQRHGSGNNQ